MCQCSHTLHHLGSKPDLPLSLKNPPRISTRRRREREEDCSSTRWRHTPSGLDSHTDFAHHQLLAVVDLLIDAATETHWKSPGTGPMTWTYALFFMHVVVPEKLHPSLLFLSLSPSLATFNITEIILCCVLQTKNL